MTNQEPYIKYKKLIYEVDGANDKAIILNGPGRRKVVPLNRVEAAIDQILIEEKDRWN